VLKTARDYIFRRMPRIRGYLGPVDALAIAAVMIGQTNAQLGGSVAEIGVFFGRSFLLMAALVGENEKALAADLFDIGAAAHDDSLQLTSFLNAAKALNIAVDRELVFVGNSKDLTAPFLLEKTGLLRFFSIDGGHVSQDVMSDAELAAQVISDFGVICFDDFFNPEWPEVTLGVLEFLRDSSGPFVPFMISEKKLFVCKEGYLDFYAELVRKSVLLEKIHKTLIHMMGRSVLFVRNSFIERARYEVFARARLGRLNSIFY
jgi:hypothetical protein